MARFMVKYSYVYFIILMSGQALALCVLAFFGIRAHFHSHGGASPLFAYFAMVVTIAIASSITGFLSAMACTLPLVLLRIRSGLGTQRLRLLAIIGPVQAFGQTLFVAGFLFAIQPPVTTFADFAARWMRVMGLLLLSEPLLILIPAGSAFVGVLAGLWLGSAIGKRRLRSGRWETIVPAEPTR